MFKVLTALALALSATAVAAKPVPTAISLERLDNIREMARGICLNSRGLDADDLYVAGKQGGWSRGEIDILMGYCALYLRGRADGLREATDEQVYRSFH